MPLWSVEEWRARIGSSYCALGVWRPVKLRGSGKKTNNGKCLRSSCFRPLGVSSQHVRILVLWVMCFLLLALAVPLSKYSSVMKRRYQLLIIVTSSLKFATIALSCLKLLLLLCGDIETNPGPNIQLKDLRTELVPIASKWYEIGIQIELEVPQLHQIDSQYSDPVQKLAEVLKFWLNLDKTASWDKMATVLHSPLVNEKELSDHLRVKYSLLEEGESKPSSVILHEALKRGYVKLHITKVIVSGSAGNGKTHTKYVLFDELEKLKEIRKSTALFDDPIRALSREIVGTNKKGWVKVTYDELNKMLAHAIKEESVSMDVEPLSTEGVSEFQNVYSDTELADSTQVSDPLVQGFTKLDVKQHTRVALPISKADVDLLKNVSSSRLEVLKLMETGKEFEQLLYLHWIHFIDSGGQPQFHELLSAFVKNTSVVMIVLKLSESLDTYPEIAYYDRKTGKLCGSTYTSSLRNDQVVRHCVQTLSREKVCQVMIVGTHRDLVKSPESISDKNKWLLKNLKQSLGEKLISYNPPDEVLFPLNADTPEEDDLKVAEEIRKNIDSDALHSYKIPIVWFLLEQDMQKLRKGVITLQECYQLAYNLNMDKVTVNAALEYFHKLNIILYYPSILKDIIFVSPQVIVDKITELIEFSFELRGKVESETEKKWERFKNFGEVAYKMLNKPRFSKHYDTKVFTSKELVLIFTRLFIMAPVTSEELPIINSVYFMPSLLPEIVAEDLENFRPKTPYLPPALLFFPDGCAPSGTFSRLSVYLISQCGWKQEDKLYRNCIKFCLGNEPGEVTIIDAFGWFELYLEAPDDVASNICYSILKKITAGLRKACEALQQENVSYSLAIMCPNRGQGKCTSSPHAAIVSSTLQYWTCTENSKNYGELVRKQSVWFSKSIPLPGVNFISQATLTILKSDELQTLEWKNHGLKIHVSPDTLPDSETQCEIAVAASLSGNMILPDKHTIVSPIFYIQPSKELKKPVTIEMEHCCSLKTEEDTKAIVPMFAQSSTKKPPYKFSPLSGKRTFTVNSSWGSFEVTTFSLFILSWFSSPKEQDPQQTLPVEPKKPPILYMAHIYYCLQNRNPKLLRLKLVITPHNMTQVVQQTYTPEEWTCIGDLSFAFWKNISRY